MTFDRLRSRLEDARPAFSPFFMLGDPNPDVSLEICRAAVQAGADMLELGIPFSDPVADGPSIQAACGRAFQAGMDVDRAFGLLEALRGDVDVPFNLLVYGNLVHRRGFDAFAARAAEVGASSVLCPDIPLEDSGPLERACASASLGLVQLCGPATSDARVRELAGSATAFLYLVGHQGVTGARDALPDGMLETVARVADASPQPICVGFGLKRRAHVEAVHARGARIAIVGSALVDHIAASVSEDGRVSDPDALCAGIHDRVSELCRGADPCS